MIKLVIFDMDGTLIDSFKDLEVTVNEVRIKMDLETISGDRIRESVGESLGSMIKKLFYDVPEKLDMVTELFREIYKKHIVDNTVPYDYIDRVLEEAGKSGLIIGVLSNKPSELVRIPLYHFNISRCMSFIYGGDSFDTKKPDGTPIKRIIDYFEVESDEAVIIGDTFIDIEAGKNAGIHTIGVNYGYSSKVEMKHCSPDRVVESPVELLEAIASF